MELYSNYSKYTQNHLEFVKFEVNVCKVTFTEHKMTHLLPPSVVI